MMTRQQSPIVTLTRAQKGNLVCVGTGLQLAGQIGALSLSYIEHADVVFSLVPDGFSERWLMSLNCDVRSLQPYYAQHDEVKNRRDTYAEMVDAILDEVRLGKLVVCALYGHPGVFACVAHWSIKQARSEGFDASMLPGISAEACLWADLGIDPGNSGHQSFEATQFMLYHHIPDPTTHLLLWQIALAGEHTLTQFSSTKDKLQILVEHLNQWYPLTHAVIIYEAANLPFQSPVIERIPLSLLPEATLTTISTLLIPPARPMTLNHEMLAKLGIVESDIG